VPLRRDHLIKNVIILLVHLVFQVYRKHKSIVRSLRFPARECSERLHMRENYCACVFEHAYMRIIRPGPIGENFSRVL
jgi:hypothetical protein